MNDQKVTIKYIFIVVMAVVFTWVIHEFAHWVTYKLLGYDAIMTLNTVSTTTGENPTDAQEIISSAAGPLITILQAIIIYGILMVKVWKKNLYPFLLTAFYMRFVAGLVNIINPNDEGRISEYFGIGLFTISIIVSGLLFYLVYKISKKNQLNWRFQLWTVVIILLASWTLILSDQFFGIRIL